MVGKRQADTRGRCRRHSDTHRRGRNGGIHGTARATRKDVSHGEGTDTVTDEEWKTGGSRITEETGDYRQTETAASPTAEEIELAAL